MIQNIIALIIVFFVVAYTLFRMYRNLKAKKSSGCNCGCSSSTKHVKVIKE